MGNEVNHRIFALRLSGAVPGKKCKARAIIVACSIDGGGQPDTQYELCVSHAEQIAECERTKGREIVRQGVDKR